MRKYEACVDFETYIRCRIKQEHKQAIDKIVRENGDIYNNPSHFVRCAIIKLIKDEQHKAKLVGELSK